MNEFGAVPAQRYDHAACAADRNKLLVYGGFTNDDSASDDLYLMTYQEELFEASWSIIKTTAGTKTPGCLSGHSMIFKKPYVIVFGGKNQNEPSNDLWLLNMEKVKKLEWQQVETSDSPAPRAHHSADVLLTGQLQGMVMIFGGQGADGKLLNDAWGLKENPDGSWIWI